MSCGLQDVVELEVAGCPAVLVHSSAFVQAAADQAVLLGQPMLARVSVPHPVQDRTDEEIRVFAREVLDAVLAAITPR